MKGGAADYLVAKTRLQALDSLRYARLPSMLSERVAAFEQANSAALGADVGLALTQRETLSGVRFTVAPIPWCVI